MSPWDLWNRILRFEKKHLDETSSSRYAQGESWMHFETIWNEAESVAKSYSGLDRKKDPASN